MTFRSPQNSFELFKGLVEHSAVGMIGIEERSDLSDGNSSSISRFRIFYANMHALEMLEFKDAGFILSEIYPLPERVGQFKQLSDDLLGRDGLSPEVILRKMNGQHFLASVSVRRITIEDKNIVLLSLRDLTFEKKLLRELETKQNEIERSYAELVEQNNQLKSLDKAKDKFIALTTHELRTPISAILATADVLELKIYESDEQRDEFIRTIGEQGRHLLELVNDILDFAKIRAGKMEFYVEAMELCEFVAKVTKSFDHIAKVDEIEMEIVNHSPTVPVWADSVRLKEVLNNVLSNAIKYNRPRGKVTITIDDAVSATGTSVARISVKDTGIGIPAHRLKSVFNEFETVENVASHHKGTGLGMPIARRLIESMGGRLDLQSEVGVGSEFLIEIPKEKVLDSGAYRSRPDQTTDFAA